MNVNYDLNIYVWQHILQQSSPIAIRALSVTSKAIHIATAQFKIDLVLANQDMELCRGPIIKCHVFNKNLISQLSNETRSLNEKIGDLKSYMNTDYYRWFLCEAARSSQAEYLTLDFFLKLCPNLDTLANSYYPTLLFVASSGAFNPIPLKMLIDAGADWRIKDLDGYCFFNRHKDIHTLTEKLMDYAKEYWKQLNRTYL